MKLQYFDAEKIAREIGLSPEDFAELARRMRAEFPRDDMMYELHLLRACMAIRDGHTTIQDLLRPEPAEK